MSLVISDGFFDIVITGVAAPPPPGTWYWDTAVWDTDTWW